MVTIKEQILNNPQVEEAIEILSNTSESQCSNYSKTIPIDNWDISGFKQNFITAFDEINKMQDLYMFEFNGDDFRPDLVITSRKLKAAYDAIPKTKTMRDVLEKVYKDFGITTDIGFHIDLDKKITDEEFDNQVEMYRMMSQISFKDLEEDDTDDK